MSNSSILIMLHCEQNTGYAIGPLEETFKQAALLAGYSNENILWSYKSLNEPQERVFKLEYQSYEDAQKLESLHKEYSIETVLAFDLPYPSIIGTTARKIGISNVISYWGASMSSINSGLKLAYKRFEWIFRRKHAPNLFIFESNSMLKTATHGRGVPKKHTAVIPLGVDTSIYYPKKDSTYAHTLFNIPSNRRIIFYSGHMEERKGVRVLINAMLELERSNNLINFHLLICGNKGTESEPYLSLLQNSNAIDHVTFAGYRNDIAELMRSSFLGAIASTGWDSFTMSSVEMMASGLPVIVSELQGLKETIVPGECGEYIQPGNHTQLSQLITEYANNPQKHQSHSLASRARAINLFSKKNQIMKISNAITKKSNHKINKLEVL
ncbi:glycosyltransferase family 4 protein [Reinekea marina]|uniref:Glycosyltransferase family 4 protein n=1 Tax=Reinekea marina TaxID=1310421 RepID=A0ABV7WRZ1_9GAMM|nr:glycosyltransferase family 4 protein [Reinekea marina]MDN3648166.1 glycosyltransferase family 4 protein [Reinekea marina]